MTKLSALILTLVLLLALPLGVLAEAKPAIDPSDLMTYFAQIEPLTERVSLNIGSDPGIYHNFYTYLAYKMGGLEMVGIDATLCNFPSGPLQVEAIASGQVDCGGYGIGGILKGSVQGVTQLVNIRMNEAITQKYFVKEDSAIAKSGVNEFGFYGTKEDWAGAQVYLPSGTTLQYLLGTAMANFDLTLADMDTVFTEATNIYTVLLSGQGDAWALWNMTSYDSRLKEGYLEALNGINGGIFLPAASVVSRSSVADPEKAEAIQKWFACEQAVIRWIQASDENLNSAIDYMYEWCDSEGVVCSYESIETFLHDATPFTMEENYEMFTQVEDNGMLKVKNMLTGPMDYFVGNGNYTEADYDKLYDDSNYNSDYLEYAVSIFG